MFSKVAESSKVLPSIELTVELTNVMLQTSEGIPSFAPHSVDVFDTRCDNRPFLHLYRFGSV